MINKRTKVECRTDSKRHCMECIHYDYCDKANCCDGNCFQCDYFNCPNNLNKERIERT